MKRILGFVIGATLGVALAYLLRRLLANRQPEPVVAPPVTNSPPSIAEEKPAATLVIRRSASRPHAPDQEKAMQELSPNGRAISSEVKNEVAETILTPAPAVEKTAATETVSEPQVMAGEVVEEAVLEAEATDDFTVIEDIGPVFDRKLREAGINSFQELADASPEDIAAKIGTNAARIEKNQWREQAAKLAADGSEALAKKSKAAKKSEE